ncbi:protein of unknown function DUF1282 [Thermodesulfatator indicus DSM 15286]|uniref:Yip1 domain-containing protein n=1 Tax=Thermodesulfatator indicus (strain DSM 15286 / JCM 11887 / CIR29812) TaxID=667014 RepID=F8AC85_THEID|nr:Yip1 family protein [Thermodesulfatator indicus]AEH45720.1 protein of unknown function DUF1282 [Thermodesulfatator indicus DSM 15286]
MNLFTRAKNIIFSPKEEWQVIAQENLTLTDLYFNYALIFIFAVFIASSFGLVLFSNLPMTSNLLARQLILSALMGVGSLFVMAYIVDFLAPRFGGEADILASHKLAVFSSTPGWVGGLLSIFPPAIILGLFLSLYGIYIFYLGVPIIKKIPQEKAVVFTIVVTLITIVFFSLISLLLSPFFVHIN